MRDSWSITLLLGKSLFAVPQRQDFHLLLALSAPRE